MEFNARAVCKPALLFYKSFTALIFHRSSKATKGIKKTFQSLKEGRDMLTRKVSLKARVNEELFSRFAFRRANSSALPTLISVVLKNRVLLFVFLIILILCFVSIVSGQVPQANYRWKSVAIGSGGGVRAIMQHPTSGEIYIRADTGAYRWDAVKNTWVSITDSLPYEHGNWQGVESLALDPSNPNNLYIAAGAFNWDTDRAFLKSTDRGRTWTSVATTLRIVANPDEDNLGWNGERLTVDPNNGQIIYFASRQDGLWRSANGGATWSRVTSFAPTGYYDEDDSGVGLSFVVFDKSQVVSGVTQTIYVGVGGDTFGGTAQANTGIWRSTDGGNNWSQIAGGPGATLSPMRAEVAANRALFVTYWNREDRYYSAISNGMVWKYAPASNTWTNITPGPEKNFVALAVDPSDANTVMAARYIPTDCFGGGVCDQIFRSTNAGTNWRGPLDTQLIMDWTALPWFQPNFPGRIAQMLIDRNNANSLWLVNHSGIWRTDNIRNNDTGQMANWKMIPFGHEGTIVPDLRALPNGTLVSANWEREGFWHNSLTAYPGNYWEDLQLYMTTSIDYAADDPTKLARVGWTWDDMVGRRGGYSTDGGGQWNVFPTTPFTFASSGQIVITKDGSRIIWFPAETSAPYFSINNGASWTRSNVPFTNNVFTSVWQRKMPVAVDRVNPNKVYFFNWSDGRAYISTDGGANFAAGGTIQATGEWDRCSLSARPGVEGDLFLTMTWRGLYRSTNSGASFTRISNVEWAELISFGKGPNANTPSLYLFGKLPNVPWGIFRSDNLGASWIRINTPEVSPARPQALEGDPNVYGRVFVGTDGRGVFYGESASLASRPQFDFDGDGKSDVSTFRPSSGVWYVWNSSSASMGAMQFGLNGDRITPADYDGDGRTDHAVFRNGIWYIWQSASSSLRALQFGVSEDVPVPGDFDGDGKFDVAVFRPSTGIWYYLQSSDNNFRAYQFGMNGDVPVSGDFDADNRTDLAVFRPSNGVWYVWNSSNNSFSVMQFGQSGDKPNVADYDGDGRTDITVWRASNGVWYIWQSSTNSLRALQFGLSGDRPAAADYDGDGKADVAVFRTSSGVWYVWQSSDNSFRVQQFGLGSDLAVPSAFVP
jgi:hypothetical protein